MHYISTRRHIYDGCNRHIGRPLRGRAPCGSITMYGLVFAVMLVNVNANHDDDDDPPVCEHGGSGIVFPMFGSEHSWPVPVQVLCYFFGLVYMFLGVSIIADLFMEAIEIITSETKTVTSQGRSVEIKVWNATVANLTLMALGSSAPEILLNVIEVTSGEFFSGALGPGTIVGSAAFNLLCIISVCCIALPDGEGRRIAEPGVFVVTAITMLFAYIWVLIILQVTSPDVVEVWEGVLTFIFFPILVYVAYGMDQGWWFKDKHKVLPTESGTQFNLDKRLSLSGSMAGGGLTPQQCKELVRSVAHTVGQKASGEKADEVIKMLALQQMKPGRAALRINAVRMMTGGKRVAPSKEKINKASETTAMLNAPELPVVQFKSDMYMVSEGDGKLDVCVSRVNARGVCSVQFETVEGTATSDLDYKKTTGTLEFADGEIEKIITIEIIDDDEPEEDEFFNVRLFNEKNCSLGEWAQCTAIIIDDDEPGNVGFDEKMQAVTAMEGTGYAELTVRRFNGSKGAISCKFRTQEINIPNGAKAGRDFEHTEELIKFDPQQMQATIRVKIIDTDKFERNEVFKVVLFEPKGPISDVAIHTHESGTSSGESIVTIRSDGEAKTFRDRVQAAMSTSVNQYHLGSSSYAEQFKTALLVNGGEMDEDDGPPACMDYVMHFITLPFKLFFATVPPSSYYNGWPCFFVALIYIGLVTALIQDLAMLFGCAVGLEDSITAITVVALGTSLPDTFASKTATVADDTADAAVGNVTGSNCVNVFLGLGLPWTLAAVKWHLSGVTPAWEKRYGYKDGREGSDPNLPNLIKRYPDGAFVVPAGSLVFSVSVFTFCSLCCLATLYMRRQKYGYELGGPKKEANMTAVFLTSLWFLYVVLSSLEAYGHFE